MIKHSILAPSSAARRMKCPGSRALEEQFPNRKNSAALEGQAAHWVAYSAVCELPVNEGEFAPNGELITREMIECANIYRKEIFNTTNLIDVLLEETLNIPDIHKDCFGTPDAWAFDKSSGTVYVWDYKYGHKLVEVYENWQLIAYALGIYAKIKLTDLNFIFTIVQPRCFTGAPIRKWLIKSVELMDYFGKLIASETDSLLHDAMLKPGAHCGYCSARHACPALRESAFKNTETGLINTTERLNDNEIGMELKYLEHGLKLIDARVSGLREEVIARIKSGVKIPFFKLETSDGREIWKKSVTEILELGKLYDIDLSKPTDLITPKQAIKKGLPTDIVRTYSDTPKITFKLTEEDNIATKIFNNQSTN